MSDTNDPRASNPRRKPCPVSCSCICHDTGGSGHDHPGEPCPGKATSEALPSPPFSLSDAVTKFCSEHGDCHANSAKVKYDLTRLLSAIYNLGHNEALEQRDGASRTNETRSPCPWMGARSKERCIFECHHDGAHSFEFRPEPARRDELHEFRPHVPRMQEALPAVEAGLWRTGRTLGRTLYFNDRCVGIVDTPELAEELVRRAHPRGIVFKVGAESFFVREKDIESAKRAFEHVRAEAVHLSDNPSLVRDALKKLGKCRNCDGRGWHWPPCDRCSDSTDDHECPPRETCGECGGDGTLPIAREALSALGADRVDYPKAPTESEGPNGS